MKNRFFLGIILSLLLITASCGDKDFLVTIETEFGTMKAILHDETPEHKANFIKLAQEGKFDSTTFHRIIEEFMIQGGDINQKPGMANEILYTIPSEIEEHLFHKKGAIGAARKGDQVNPNRESSGSQFYIVDGRQWSETELRTDMTKLNNAVAKLIRKPGYDSIGQELIKLYETGQFDAYNRMMLELIPDAEYHTGMNVSREAKPERVEVYTTVGGAPWLDDEYTVFGQVVEGFPVIDKIAAVKTGRQDKPTRPIYMKVSVEEVSKKKLTEKYGIIYED